MIEIIHNGETKVIDTDLSIKRFQELHKNYETLVKTRGGLLAFYMDMDIKQMKKIPKGQIDFVESYVASQMTAPNQDELVMTFEHNGIKYGLENDWGKLAWGAWVDFEVLSADNPIEKIHHIMAVLYRPIIWEKNDKYKIAEYDEDEIGARAEEFKELPVRYWFGAAGFFFQIVELYIIDIKNSLELQKKMRDKAMLVMNKLPNFLKPKRLRDIIFNYPSNLRVRI
jgi:hypothetical protein